MPRNPVLVILLVLTAFCTPAGSRAGAAEEPRLSSFQFYTENDTYLPTTTDKYYTNGIRIAWLRNPNGPVPAPGWTHGFLDWWCRTGLCVDPRPDVGYGHALGQNMYTPTSIVNPNPQPQDRPWAGYLYYSWIVSATHPGTAPSGDRAVQNLFELQAGLVGPGAGAKFAQSTIHRIIHSPQPRGWSNQLKNEPTANLIYLWRKKLGGETFDVVPHWGAGLGNVTIYANAGATARFGYHISGFPVRVITPSFRAERKNPEPFEFFVFAGGDGRFVPHNIFLDGNTFRSGPEIDVRRKDLVYDLQAGATLRYKAWQLAYTYVRRSQEFAPPFGTTDGVHRFGSIALSWNLWRP
jgi:lipid A 3-O-deacylase